MTTKNKHFKFEKFGDDMYGVRILGDKSKPESSEFRVAFPGGDVVITRTSDGSYWVHASVEKDPVSCEWLGEIFDTRIDEHDGRPVHAAVRIRTTR